MAPDLAGCLPPLAGEVANAGAFRVQEIPGFAGHYAGRDDHGRACILLGSVDDAVRAPLRLTGLEVQYALVCAVELHGQPAQQQTLTVITCTLAADGVERYFLHIMSTLVELVGVRPTLQAVAEGKTRLAGIFQKLSAPARASVTGIIGELVVIARSRHPLLAVEAWRSDFDERYDFSRGILRLEIKSTNGRRRVHGFSFEQCAIPPGCRGILGSLFVEMSAGGTSLEGLVQTIRLRLAGSGATILKLEQTLAHTLGEDLPVALQAAFDLQLATSSLAFFDMTDVPAVRGNLPNGVSQVHFVSDLGDARPVSPAILQELLEFDPFLPMES